MCLTQAESYFFTILTPKSFQILSLSIENALYSSGETDLNHF